MWSAIILSTAVTLVIFLRMFMPHLRGRNGYLRTKTKPRDVRADFWQYVDMKKMLQENR